MSTIVRTTTVVLLVLLALLVAGGAVLLLRSAPEPGGISYAWRVDPALTAEELDRYDAAPRSEEVLTAALRGSGVEDPAPGDVATLRDQVRAELVAEGPDGPRLDVRVAHDDRDVAERRGRALAGALETWDAQVAADRTAATPDDVDARLRALDERIRTLQVFGAGDDDEDLRAALAEREALLAGSGADTAADAPAPGALTRIAAPSPLAAVPAPTIAAVGAALVLALLATAAAFAWRGRRRFAGDGHTVRVLAEFASDPPDGDGATARDAAGVLRSAVLDLTPHARPRVFLISSPVEGEGKTTVARHLAEDLASRGFDTLLVDGNLASPALAERYQVDEAASDATTTLEWLQGIRRAGKVIPIEGHTFPRPDLVPQFRPARPAPGTAPALFAGFHSALRAWDHYEVIVVDASPFDVSSDAPHLARYATGVVLVRDPARSEPRDLSRARRLVQAVDGTLLGVVVNRSTATGGGGAAPSPARPRTRAHPDGGDPFGRFASGDRRGT